MKIACIIAYDISFVGQTIDILRDVESSIQEYSLLMTRCVVKKEEEEEKKKKEYFRYAFPRYYSPYMYIYICCVRGMLVFFWCKFITQHPFFPLSFATTTGATAAFIQAFVETTFPFHSLINHRDVTGYVIYIEKNVEKGAKRMRVYLQKEESSIIVVTIAYFLISACHDSLMNEAP